MGLQYSCRELSAQGVRPDLRLADRFDDISIQVPGSDPVLESEFEILHKFSTYQLR